MLKALLKKQMLETLAFFLFDGKKGKQRSKGAAVGFAALFLYAFGAIVFMFWALGGMLCTPLVESGLNWVYFAFMGLMAFALGFVGSVFTVKGKLYEARDNEALLAMPIPTWMILFVRILGLYLYVLFFEALVFVPAIVQYVMTVGGILPIICGGFTLLLMPLGTLAISGLLGWLIALVSARLPLKNFFTALFAAGFMALYFFLYSKINEYLGYLITHGAVLGEKIKNVLFPFWKMGQAATGDCVALLLYALIFVGAFALVYFLIAKTFLRFVTMKRGFHRIKYKATLRGAKRVFWVLLGKESLRFLKNPMIALNTLLGTIMYVVFAVYLFAQPALVETVRNLNVEVGEGIVGLLFTAVLCGIAAMNIPASSSISLEGENLWLLRSMPISTRKILFVKAFFQFISTMVPAFLCSIILGAFIKLSWWSIVLTILIVAAFAILTSLFGVTLNLKFPNLHWTYELVVVKQSLSTLLGAFGGIGMVALLVGGYFLFGQYMPAWGYSAGCFFALMLGDIAFWLWLRKRGVRIFENL